MSKRSFKERLGAYYQSAVAWMTGAVDVSAFGGSVAPLSQRSKPPAESRFRPGHLTEEVKKLGGSSTEFSKGYADAMDGYQYGEEWSAEYLRGYLLAVKHMAIESAALSRRLEHVMKEVSKALREGSGGDSGRFLPPA